MMRPQLRCAWKHLKVHTSLLASLKLPPSYQGTCAGSEHAALLTHPLTSIHPHASSQVCTELTVSHTFIHTHISLHNLALTHSFSNTAAVEAHIRNSIMSSCTQPSSHIWPSLDHREEGPMWTQQPCHTRAGQCGAALATGREAGLFYIGAALWEL